jgi:hypothetical protein
LQPADGFVAVRGEVNVVTALGEAPQDGFEISEIGKVPAEEQDLHW